MSVSKALAVLDERYATHRMEVTQRSERTQNTAADTLFYPPSSTAKGSRRSGAATEATGDTKERLLLPAFTVCARDGPSPFDPHRGGYQCSIDDVLDDGLLYDLGPVRGKAAYISAHRDEIEKGQVTSDGFQTVTALSRVLPATDAAGEGERVFMTNPQRDRLRLQADLDQKRKDNLFRHTRQQKSTLYAACVLSHPHGALGISESPYGEPGAVYAEHARQLRRANNRQCCNLRHPQSPQDHMTGSLVTAVPAEQRRGIRCEPPADHLWGATVVFPFS